MVAVITRPIEIAPNAVVKEEAELPFWAVGEVVGLLEEEEAEAEIEWAETVVFVRAVEDETLEAAAEAEDTTEDAPEGTAVTGIVELAPDGTADEPTGTVETACYQDVKIIYSRVDRFYEFLHKAASYKHRMVFQCRDYHSSMFILVISIAL